MATTERSAVQRLYELCKETFSPQGQALPLSAVQRFIARLDTIRSEDVGLDEAAIMEIERRSSTCSRSNKKRRRSESTAVGSRSTPNRTLSPPVTYIHLHECAAFSIGIFCLPASAIIPLHDHSEMTVFTKLLYGSMNVKAYDWLDPSPITSQPLHWKLAALKTDDDFQAPREPWVLYPTTGGNIHSFRAITSCAVLDVLSPPYTGDNPSYYREHPSSSFPARHDERAEERAWLEKLERPENFILRIQPYRGPIIEE